MAKWNFKGINEYVGTLEKLGKKVEDFAGSAIYEGAKLVADEVHEAIRTIPIDNAKYQPNQRHGITEKQRQGLLDGFGIASLQNSNGYLNVKLGFDGYNDFKTDAYPNGQPNLLIARSIESGTSFMPKYQTISKAVAKARKRCEEKMREELDKQIEKEIS